MSFDKYFPNRKDHRKQYRGAKRFDRTCRNHGSCGYCRNNRLVQQRRSQAYAKDQLIQPMNSTYEEDES